jgi:hypothetical protein
MGNLEKRIEHLENLGAPSTWEEVSAEQLTERVNAWIESGGAARALETRDPIGLRILELLSLAQQRSKFLAAYLEKRIEKLEQVAGTTDPHAPAEDMTEAEFHALLPLLPDEAKELLEKISFEDLTALEEGHPDEISPEGVAQFNRLEELIAPVLNEHYGETNNPD